MEKVNFLSFGCRCVTYPFSIRTFFFFRPGKRTQNRNSNRNFVVHIFVYQRVVQVEAQDKGQANQIFDIFSIGNPYNGCIYVYIYISLLLGL